jgi:hypothetical protein
VSPFHQSSKNPRIGRTAANEAMRAELEYVADHSDRSRGAGLERATLQLLGSIAENDVIDFGRRKPSDLNRRVQQDQFFKLNLQRVQIPLPFLPQAIDGKTQQTLLIER